MGLGIKLAIKQNYTFNWSILVCKINHRLPVNDPTAGL